MERAAPRTEQEADKLGLGEWDFGTDNTPIPPRAWLLGNIFCRGFISSLVGPGGAGKTAVRLAQLLSLAVGRSLTGEHVFERCRVLIVSLEDDTNELRRRLNAAMLHHQVEQQELVGWLFIVTPSAKGWKLAKTVNGVHVEEELGPRLEHTIKRRRIDIVSLDPLVKTHSVDENANAAVDFVVSILARIAVEHNVAVDVPHHVSKGPSAAGNADRARGGSAVVDAGRLVYTLWPMSEKEAESYGIDEQMRKLLVRMDSAKVNLAPPGAGTCWFRLVGVRLGNPSPDGRRSADRGALDAAGNMGRSLLLAAQRDIDRNRGRAAERLAVLKSAEGRRSGRSPHRAETSTDKTEGQAREIIRTWIKNRVLSYVDYEDPVARKDHKGSAWTRQNGRADDLRHHNFPVAHRWRTVSAPPPPAPL